MNDLNLLKAENYNRNAYFTRYRLISLFLVMLAAWMTLLPVAQVYAQLANNPSQTKPLLTGEELRKKKESSTKSVTKDEQFSLAAGVKEPALGTQSLLTNLKPVDRLQRKLNTEASQNEKLSLRNLQSRTYGTADGVEKTVTEVEAQNYKDVDGKFKPISGIAVEDDEYIIRNKQPESILERALPGSDQAYGLKAETGTIKTHFETLTQGGIRMVYEGKDIIIKPKADSRVRPQQIKKSTQSYIEYKNVWPGTDLVYEYKGTTVKEDIVVNKRPESNKFVFDIAGARVVPDPNKEGGLILDGPSKNKLVVGNLTLNINKKGPLVNPPVKQYSTQDGRQLTVEIDQKWLDAQSDDVFPLVIDPSIHDVTGIPGGYYGDFTCHKSDGTSIHGSTPGPSGCNVNTGGLDDNGPKYWRTVMRLPYDQVNGRQLLQADLYMPMMTTPGWHGTYDARTINIAYATCNSFHCVGGPYSSAPIGVDGTINITNTLQWMVNNVGYGGYLIAWGEEPSTSSFKEFNGGGIQLHTYTNQYPTQPAPESPSSNASLEAVVTTTEPQLKVSKSSDPNGDSVFYEMTVRTLNDNVVWSSGFSQSRQAILPEGVLQDGGKYKWEYRYHDGWWGSDAISGGAFRVDLLTSKDKAHIYDQMGPLSIGLNNGNVHTSVSTQSMAALGGDIGLKLDYNSPFMAKKGLQAEYFNNGNHSGNPQYRRVEPNIDQDWDLGSPVTGVVGVDNYSIRWTGFFVAPQSGDYYFGGLNDDGMKVTVGGQVMYNQGCGGSASCFGAEYKTLVAGSVTSIVVEYSEVSGPAYATLSVKGAVAEQVIPADWLRTKPLPTERVSGLTGHYYYDNGSHDPSQLTKFLVRDDTTVNFSWGTNAPVQGAPNDNFYIKWEGSYTAPTAGTYKFGVAGDDSIKVAVNGLERASLWGPHTESEKYDSTGIMLTENQTVSISVDYYELTGSAQAKLLLNGPQGIGEINPQHLGFGAKPLPAGWSFSPDAGGSVPYERLSIRQNGDAIVYDGDGTSWLFTNTGSGFSPPINSDATLLKNSDASYTLTDADGKIYGFSIAGTLLMTSSPVDDRNPAALQYSYETQNGLPRLKKIIDAVNPARFGTLYYQGDTACRTPYGGFDADPPAGMLCGFETTDGQYTQFMYNQGKFTLISNPGWQDTGIAYDKNGTLVGYRDAMSGDAVYSGAYSDPDYNLSFSWIWYDQLGRSVGMESPVPSVGEARDKHYIEYFANATKRHQVDAPEPMGYSQYIEYDNLLRTTKHCDNLGKCSTTEYDPTKDMALSTTDALGLKSTTIYDDEDRPIKSYGPAPASWFDANREPLATYVNSMPRTDSSYDEGINGPAVAYYSYEGNITPAGKLYGAPKLYSTGIQDITTTTNIVPNQSVETVDSSNSQEPQGWSTDSWGTNTRQFSYVDAGHTGSRSVKTEVTNYTDGDAKWRFDPITIQPNKTYNYKHYYQSNITSDIVLQFTDAAGANTYQWLETLPSAISWMPFDLSFTTPASAAKVTVLQVVAKVGWVQVDDASLTALPDNPASLQKIWTTDPVPAESGREGWGMSLSGKLRLPAAGAYQIKAAHDDGVKVWIDDQLIVDDWTAGTLRDSIGGFNHEAGKVHRIRVDYFSVPSTTGTNASSFNLSLKQTNGFDWTSDWTNYLKPGYGLTTSTKTYDTQLGSAEIKAEFTNPAYGVIKDVTIDPNGSATKSTTTFEDTGTGYLRQLSKTTAGGTTTTYQHWGALATADNPCTTGVESIPQAGFAKGRTDPDPDGAGSEVARKTETLYDSTGRVAANRIGTDPWTCITYDNRGKTAQIVVPTVSARDGRTLTYTYNEGGNPLVSKISDDNGHTTTKVDLLGRIRSFRDTHGTMTDTSYNSLGQVSQRLSKLGTETYQYDSYGRLTSYMLDTIMLATIIYDTFGRVQEIVYPSIKDPTTNQPLKLNTPKRDQLERLSGLSYTLPNNQQLSNEVTFSQSGVVLDESLNGVDLSTGAQSYEYDKSGRLASANIAGHSYSYDFGAPDAACNAKSSNNQLAGKNSNRMRQTVDGVTTWYCYDNADRLISSSDATYDAPAYDGHGNTTSLGAGTSVTSFKYDQTDRNTEISQGVNSKVVYKRDHANRVTQRQVTENGSTNNYYYGATGGGNYTFMFTDNVTKQVVEKYLSLPGGVALTLRPDGTTTAEKSKISLGSLHGSTLATLNGDGVNESGTLLYDPFGTQISATTSYASANSGIVFAASTSKPNNAQGNQALGWAGTSGRATEIMFASAPMQMGARVYIPGLGRFLGVDPIEGGGPNNYAYTQDPINTQDFSGEWGLPKWVSKAVKVVIAVVIAVVVVLACIAFCAAAVTVAAPIIAAAGAVVVAAAKISKPVVAAVKSVTTKSGGGTAAPAVRSAPPLNGYSPSASIAKTQGVYSFNGASGNAYIGRSVDMSARVGQHSSTGKYPGGVVNTHTMSDATLLQVRIQEQNMINAAGGVRSGQIENKINSIATKYWNDLNIKPPQ